MTTTTAPATITYRKTQHGEWVAFGPASVLNEGPVTITKRDGTTKTEIIESLGRPFEAKGTRMVYGYLAKSARSSSGYRRRSTCISGGDCSSFGSGRSCGAPDCDGY